MGKSKAIAVEAEKARADLRRVAAENRLERKRVRMAAQALRWVIEHRGDTQAKNAR